MACRPPWPNPLNPFQPKGHAGKNKKRGGLRTYVNMSSPFIEKRTSQPSEPCLVPTHSRRINHSRRVSPKANRKSRKLSESLDGDQEAPLPGAALDLPATLAGNSGLECSAFVGDFLEIGSAGLVVEMIYIFLHACPVRFFVN